MDKRIHLMEKEGIQYLSVPHWNEAGILNAFSCRSGGVSPPPYESLNLALHLEDDPVNVIRNRRLFLDVFGLELENTVCCQQVHGSGIEVVTPEMNGKGALNAGQSLPDCDAMVCGQPGVVMMTFYGDCIPLFIVDPVRQVAATAHAGWKGTCLNIGGKTVELMCRTFGSALQDLEVFIGPGIGACCYEISRELAEQVELSLPKTAGKLIEERGGRKYWDLPATNFYNLVAKGLQPEKIFSSSLCTSCYPELFYSHRLQHGITGRMGAMLSLVSK